MNLKINRAWLTVWPMLEGISQSLNYTIALVGGLFAIGGMLSVGELASFIMLSWAISDPMRMLGVIFNDLERFITSSAKVIELYYDKPTVATRPEAMHPSEDIKGEIEFRNGTFAYGKNTVVSGINLHIAPGETVAVMGSTGSGKTTLLNLIPRFYDVKEGSVLVDGRDVRDYPIADLRAAIGIATQEVFLFSDTVEGNIAYGDVDLPLEDVKRFAKMADAEGFIGSMPEGFDTIIGERGVGLSGGQRQRIALARAMAISPRILILDDTTSAVDLETEKYIQEQLREIGYPCTKLIVAQRISSVRDADKIVILADGAIAEMGTHEELIAKDGYYKEIYEVQQGS
jgi:ATP-binding cassette subfamily B protein